MTDDELMAMAAACTALHAQPGAKYPHPGCAYCAHLAAYRAANPGPTPDFDDWRRSSHDRGKP